MHNFVDFLGSISSHSFHLIIGGYMKLIAHFERKLRASPLAEIILDCQVKEIIQSCDSVSIETSRGVNLAADCCLVTLPLGVLKDSLGFPIHNWSANIPTENTTNVIKFSPELSPKKQTAIKKLGVGVLDKVAFGFDIPFWKEGKFVVSDI